MCDEYHIIEIVRQIIVVFIDYATNISIVKQTILIIKSIDKLNLRLMHALFYLSQFDLKIKYRFNKINIMLDTLLQLSFENDLTTIDCITLAELDLVSYYVDIDDLFDDSNNYII